MPRIHAVIEKLRAIVGDRGVLSDPGELSVYENDGFPIAKGLPVAVVFPTTTGEVVRCVKTIVEHGLGVVPRGSGTGLTGGCVTFDDGVLISTTRMNQIESIDLPNRLTVVQAGVRNQQLTDAIADRVASQPPTHHDNPHPARGPSKPAAAHQVDNPLYKTGLRFAPDPSSQKASTIGGNAATNAGGISTLKYGVTCHHILGLEMVLPDGSVVQTRAGGLCDGIGPDLTGLICGSEGTLGIITRLWCRLTPIPIRFRTLYAVFDSSDHACQTVSDIIASGSTPSSMEMLDGPMIRVVEEAFRYGFPTDVQALLLVEIDGVDPGLDDELKKILKIAETHGARDVEHCSHPARRARLWEVRKRAFGAIGRISRSYCTQDACIPRSKLPEAMLRIAQISREHGLVITNVFHAGDGNVHPILLFDEDDPQQVQRVLKVSELILNYCISIGGTITGEHGVGVEKLHLMTKMFNAPTMQVFDQIKEAFDPDRRINDGKLIPSPKLRIDIITPLSINTPGGAM